MNVAGLHFGHDAGGAVVGDDGLCLFLDKERRSRVKHAMGLSSTDVREVLKNVSTDAIVGLSSTQLLPVFLDRGLEIAIEGGVPTAAREYFGTLRPDYNFYHKMTTWDPNFVDRDGIMVPEELFPHISSLNQEFNRSYGAMGYVSGHSELLASGMRREARLHLDGKVYRANFYQHHYLHAYYAAWSLSPDKPALVVTYDGGMGPSFSGGGIYHWTPGRVLCPVTPVDGWLGLFYNQVSQILGLGMLGAGKLMGLAPYGRPIFFDPSLIGTRHQVTDGYQLKVADVVNRWLSGAGLVAEQLKVWDHFTDRPPALVADIAASAQLILELNLQELLKAAKASAERAGFDYDVIALAGGVALNCPSNTDLMLTSHRPVLIPPAVNDEGLSIGAALAAYFDSTGRMPAPPRDFAEAAYIGTDVDEQGVAAAAQRHGWVREAGDAVGKAAAYLRAGRVVGMCVGRSEAGPRALGHRSILADPTCPETWRKVNGIKGREPWRPFAPAVLLERSNEYFDRGPAVSRYMLFNYRCTTKRLPAITHYDHSARLQHVSTETGLLYDLLLRLEQDGAPPVLLNTSFNGPGVPIVDTADDVFAEASTLSLYGVLSEWGLYVREPQP